MIEAAPSLILTAAHLDALSLCYKLATIEDVATIHTLQSLHLVHPELVTVRTPHDADLYERVEAIATPLGRSLVHAYLVGQCEAYQDVRRHAERKTCDCLQDLDRWEAARDAD